MEPPEHTANSVGILSRPWHYLDSGWQDELPLELDSRLVPISTSFKMGLQMRLHLHGRMMPVCVHSGSRMRSWNPDALR
jgi:hypothetical protein